MTPPQEPLHDLEERVRELTLASFERRLGPAEHEELERLHLEEDQLRRDAELQEAAVEEADLLSDLAAVGVVVPTVWDLHEHPGAFPDAAPVLLAHLARDHPRGVLECIGVALAHKAVRPWWDDLVRAYETDEREVVRERLAATLATVAVREHHDDLLRLFSDPTLGPSRVLLVRPLHRTGNRVAKGRGRAEIEPWADDPVVGREVRAVLAGRSRSR